MFRVMNTKNGKVLKGKWIKDFYVNPDGDLYIVKHGKKTKAPEHYKVLRVVPNG